MEKFRNAIVDLDAVLDEFEYHQDQAERDTASTSPSATGFFSPIHEKGPGSPEKLLRGHEPFVSSTDCEAVTKNHDPDPHPFDEPTPIPFDLSLAVPTSVNDPITPQFNGDQITAEEPNLIDIDNDVLVPNTEQIKVLAKVADDSPAASDSPVVFESIYDKYKDEGVDLSSATDSPEMEDDEPDLPHEKHNGLEPIVSEVSKTNESEEPQENPCVYQPANDIPDDELNEMLERLETEDSSELPVGVETYQDTGARPKESSPFYMQTSTNCDNEITAVLSNGFATASDHRQVGSDIATNDLLSDDLPPEVGSEEPVREPINEADLGCVGEDLPPDSPPPYSEVDPMRTDKPERPTSLEIPARSSSLPEEQSSDPDRVSQGSIENAVVGPPGSTPANPTGPDTMPALLQGLSEEQLMLGKVQPFWVPDTDAPTCMICEMRFTMVKRRHHCRACGKVLCSTCCSDKAGLPYMSNKEARVCKPCKSILERLERASDSQTETDIAVSAPSASRPNPANPMEYCSTIPPHQQASASTSETPSVMVPVGVLKRWDGQSPAAEARSRSSVSSEAKQVMFSDGIRPGGDLTELDGSPERRPVTRRPRPGMSRRPKRLPAPAGSTDIARSLLPPGGALPYISGKGPGDPGEVCEILGRGEAVAFSVNRNLRVYVKLILYTPINGEVWSYRTQGLTSVGQDEIVFLLSREDSEPLPPTDIFHHIQMIYEQAGKGAPVTDMGYSVVGLDSGSTDFLGTQQHGGFLYIRHTFQCVQNLDLPPPPFLFGILLTKWEMPWARMFPLRLMLRLGSEFRYYPAPLWSVRNREPVFKEIGNTIMKLLIDFRNFTYSLPIIRGLVIHMENQLTTILIPKNRYKDVQKALQNSNEPVLALGANFSSAADSHLVAKQREEDEPSRNPMSQSDYETQAINIVNKLRKVTGASFVVFNGALKSSSGLTAKSSIVEDGLMVQVTSDRMTVIRKALHNMENYEIGCGPVGQPPDEVINIKWLDDDRTVNLGIKSLIDGSPMDGIPSMRIHSGLDYASGEQMIRWTEVFIVNNEPPNESSGWQDPPDPARTAEHVAKAVCIALRPYLANLKEAGLSPLAVRVNLDPENVGYEAGSCGSNLPPEYMNPLDNELVPIIHSQSGAKSSLELVFHILDC